MNKEQLKILTAFDVTMQTLIEVWETKQPKDICIMAFGGASAMHLLASQTLHAPKSLEQAKMILNQVASELNFPLIP